MSRITMTPSRRALLAGAPAVAATALAAGTAASGLAAAVAHSGTDPIHDVIVRHRDALDRQAKARKHLSKMDKLYSRETEPEEFWSEWTVEQRTAWWEAETERCKGNPRDLAHDRWNDCCEALAALSEVIITTRPTTIAGIAAVPAHWAVVADDSCTTTDRDFEPTIRLIETLAEAAKSIAEAQS